MCVYAVCVSVFVHVLCVRMWMPMCVRVCVCMEKKLACWVNILSCRHQKYAIKLLRIKE